MMMTRVLWRMATYRQRAPSNNAFHESGVKTPRYRLILTSEAIYADQHWRSQYIISLKMQISLTLLINLGVDTTLTLGEISLSLLLQYAQISILVPRTLRDGVVRMSVQDRIEFESTNLGSTENSLDKTLSLMHSTEFALHICTSWFLCSRYTAGSPPYCNLDANRMEPLYKLI